MKIAFIAGLVYISVWVGIGVGSMGQIPTCNTSPYGVEIPIMLFVTMGIPFALGVLSNK